MITRCRATNVMLLFSIEQFKDKREQLKFVRDRRISFSNLHTRIHTRLRTCCPCETRGQGRRSQKNKTCQKPVRRCSVKQCHVFLSCFQFCQKYFLDTTTTTITVRRTRDFLGRQSEESLLTDLEQTISNLTKRGDRRRGVRLRV